MDHRSARLLSELPAEGSPWNSYLCHSNSRAGSPSVRRFAHTNNALLHTLFHATYFTATSTHRKPWHSVLKDYFKLSVGLIHVLQCTLVSFRCPYSRSHSHAKTDNKRKRASAGANLSNSVMNSQILVGNRGQRTVYFANVVGKAASIWRGKASAHVHDLG